MNWWHRWTERLRRRIWQLALAIALAMASVERHRVTHTPIPVVQSVQWVPPRFPMLPVRAFGPRLV